MIKYKIYILLILFFIVTDLLAQELITDRPDQTESSSTVPANSLQVESGIILEETEYNSIVNKNFIFPSTLFRYGLTDEFEIRVVSQFEKSEIKISSESNSNNNVTSGFSDLEVGAKVQLFQKDNVNVEVAFLSHLVIPTGSTSFTNEKLGSINKLSISHTLTKIIDVGYNIGYDYFSKDISAYTYSLVASFAVDEQLGIFIETYGEIEDQENITKFDCGITYLLKKHLQFDFSFGTGINTKMNFVALGFSWKSKL